MDLDTIFTLTHKELHDARQNRWLLLFTVSFSILSLALAWFSLAGMGNYGLAGFGRTGASLINLILMIVPLMGLTMGALSMTGEREKGTLMYLLAQPISRTELLLGKFLGLSLALTIALGIGFGLTGVLLALNSGLADFSAYALLILLSILLAIVSLSIGFLISIVVSRAATAVGVALFAWLLLVLLGDLGLMGTAVVLKLSLSQLLFASLINPLQIFKLAAVLELRSNLEILGPAGVYAVRTFGRSLLPLLGGLLLIWIALPLLTARHLFSKRGAL